MVRNGCQRVVAIDFGLSSQQPLPEDKVTVFLFMFRRKSETPSSAYSDHVGKVAHKCLPHDTHAKYDDTVLRLKNRL